jgi:hypothetical protein
VHVVVLSVRSLAVGQP